jgi:tetratricopeptide (TPR) repeat protein
LASAVAVALLGGCGVVQDMRSEYVANRALRDATDELQSARPHLDRARAHLDLAFRLRRSDPRFVARLAEGYRTAGGFERAIECYETQTKLTGMSRDSQIGYCLLKLGKTRAGAERLERALEQAGDDLAHGRIGSVEYAVTLNDAGYAFVDANLRVDEALKLIEEALRLEPLQPAYIDSLGWAYYRQGKYQDAAFHLERAARLLGRRDAEILWHLGAVHAQLGKLRRAESELREALVLDPANSEARRTLREMLRELPPPAMA